MILVDFTNIGLSGILSVLNKKEKKTFTPLFEDEVKVQEIEADAADIRLIRHIILNTLLSYKKKYPDKGKIVLCCEGKSVWRKKIFKEYKASRAKARDDSPINWGTVFSLLEQYIAEFKENMPFIIMRADEAESDDCIAVLARNLKEDHVIVANDKDFHQLLSLPNVIQYAPNKYGENKVKGVEIKIDDPVRHLKEQIIRGDEGDGVPNIFDDDDTLVNRKKKTTIYAKKVLEWLDMDYSEFCSDMDKVKRNQTMIDLSFIPTEIEDRIINEFENYTENSYNKIYPYFIKNRLSRLISDIRNF